MNEELYFRYREQFGCRIAMDCVFGKLALVSPERKLYSVEAVTEEEINDLMRESIEKGENVLLERLKDKEYTVEVKPDCDY